MLLVLGLLLPLVLRELNQRRQAREEREEGWVSVGGGVSVNWGQRVSVREMSERLQRERGGEQGTSGGQQREREGVEVIAEESRAGSMQQQQSGSEEGMQQEQQQQQQSEQQQHAESVKHEGVNQIGGTSLRADATRVNDTEPES